MRLNNWIRAAAFWAVLAALCVAASAYPAMAQDTGPAKPGPAQQPEQPKPPTGQQQPKQQPGQENGPRAEISVESTLVNIDAVVTDNDGNVVTGLKRENFRILDENKPQQISVFAPTDAPITVVILMEFSAEYYGFFGYKSRDWAWGFLNHLAPKDWVAFKIFDIKTDLLVDFTQDKREVRQAVASLYVPGFHEENLFDSLIETLDELRDVHGKKSILLLSTGKNSFSKHTLDQTYKRLKETDVTIFSIGMGEEKDLYNPQGAGVGYLQAKNQLTQFADMTGGHAWFPRFYGEMPDIFNAVAAFLRSQYTLGFSPSTPADGKFHKLKVEVVDDQGNPLLLEDRKGKKKKVVVYARNGYTSPRLAAGGN